VGKGAFGSRKGKGSASSLEGMEENDQVTSTLRGGVLGICKREGTVDEEPPKDNDFFFFGGGGGQFSAHKGGKGGQSWQHWEGDVVPIMFWEKEEDF